MSNVVGNWLEDVERPQPIPEVERQGWNTPTPSPSKLLVFLKLAAICAQDPLRVRLTGKIFLTKELAGLAEGQTGRSKGRWVESR